MQIEFRDLRPGDWVELQEGMGVPDENTARVSGVISNLSARTDDSWSKYRPWISFYADLGGKTFASGWWKVIGWRAGHLSLAEHQDKRYRAYEQQDQDLACAEDAAIMAEEAAAKKAKKKKQKRSRP